MPEFTNKELESTNEVTEEIVTQELTVSELESINGGNCCHSCHCPAAQF